VTVVFSFSYLGYDFISYNHYISDLRISQRGIILIWDLVVYTSIKYTNWSMDTMGYNKAADINPRLLQRSAIATLMHVLNISVMHNHFTYLHPHYTSDTFRIYKKY